MTNKTLSTKCINKPKELIFAIRKETTHGGTTNYIPVCANKPLIKYFAPYFTRIVLLEGQYQLSDLDIQTKLTEAEALSHIEGYKKQLETNRSSRLATIEIIQVI